MTNPNGKEQGRLSLGLTDLWMTYDHKSVYDVVIVGSGYGGSVAAATFAGCTVTDGGKSRPVTVCVLERGKEYLPGEFPSSFSELPGHLRIGRQNSGEVGGQHEGLFDVRLGDDVVALVANGVGGGSLINAGVMLRPDLQDFEDPVWRGLLQQLEKDDYFNLAMHELGGTVERNGKEMPNTIERHPDYAKVQKTKALHRLAEAGERPFALTPITVAMDELPNSAGISLKPCNLCGDCMSGCNVGAKDSLDVNLLHKAHQAGAEIYTGASVLSLKRDRLADVGPHWVLRVAHTDPRLQAREKDLLFLRARKVILAAGSLGSPEILLRSRDDKHVFSTRLGEGFSCNGDNIAAVHRMPVPTNGCADEDQPLDKRDVGPTITAAIAVRERPRGFQVQEFSVPGPMKRLFEEIVTTANALNVLPTADEARHGAEGGAEGAEALDPLAVNPEHMQHTLLVGVIGHDDARGTLHLPVPLRPIVGHAQPGAVRIRWPDARDACALESSHAQLGGLVSALPKPAALIANPMWRLLPPGLEQMVSQPRGPVVTVHPLGGCGMAGSYREGVVDEDGCVFNVGAADGDNWFGSLVVLDGSIIPGSLGVNPALTITALAMRAAERLRGRWKFVDGGSAPLGKRASEANPHAALTLRRLHIPMAGVGAPSGQPAAVDTTIEVVERLRGPVALHAGETLPRTCIVELTLAYEPTPVKSLMSTLSRTIHVRPGESRLRIFDKEEWENNHLRFVSDLQRDEFALFDAHLKGSLRFLHREPSTPLQRRLRSLWAWLWNRGLRDTWQHLFDKQPASALKPACPPEPGVKPPRACILRDLWRLASRAGEVRRFDYALTVGEIVRSRLANPNAIRAGDAIAGSKRLTYQRRASPWRQLTELAVERMPAMRANQSPILTLDPRFLANQGMPLLRITQQRDHASALAELFSFALYMARVLVSTHLWTFRKPDTPSTAEPVRLPGPIAGLPLPQITELVVDRMPDDRSALVKIRLTRYAREPRPEPPPNGEPPTKEEVLAPLVMIHGYSVSGNTFTHETLAPSAAEFFWHAGRDVWVVDLRTSAGLPTATCPWAFEQAALIDIPAALLHIRNATQSKVDVLAHCIGCAMLGMAVLTDAKEVRESKIQLGVDAWLTSEHFGTLTAFNGPVPQGDDGHPCIRRIVLSQKGPVLRYTDENVFRAFVLQSVRRWLLADDYQFRPPRKPTVADELLDRLLASLPYPDSDYDIENPLAPWAKTRWTATRHRMDALYGRDFSADNMSAETLGAIDDLFGPINLDTVSQTIHFARFTAITNQRGRGEFVTRGRLRERWRGMPTLAIHGRDNGLADVDTQRLLDLHLRQWAGVLFDKRTYDRMGHQDVLIGNWSARVFSDIDTFLRSSDEELKAASASAPDSPRAPVEPDILVFGAPWLGPRIELTDVDGGGLRLACMSRPDQGRATLYLLPGRRRVVEGVDRFEPCEWEGCVTEGERGPSGRWLFAEPPLDTLAARGAGEPGLGWFAVFAYPFDETKAEEGPGWPIPVQPRDAVDSDLSANGAPPTDAAAAKPPVFRVGLPGLGSGELGVVIEAGPLAAMAAEAPAGLRGGDGPARRRPMPPAVARALIDGLKMWLGEQSAREAAQCFVHLDDLQRALKRHRPPQQGGPLSFALASCQYPPGIFDRPVAQASLAALCDELDRIDLVLLVGDQIYADATAGVMDPVRRDELYDEPHDKALRVRPMRELLRRVPVQMLLDDHELSDNWEPMAPELQAMRAARAAKVNKARRAGFAAYRKYQRMRRGHLLPRPQGPADLEFSFAGYPFYLADTRTGRSPRGSAVDAEDVQILCTTQWEDLQAWLLKDRHGVKFVATPSLLLPRRRATAEGGCNHVRSDSWDGFPGSMQRLLEFIAGNDIRNTVFLSGDEHHSLFAEIWLRPADAAQPVIKLVSVHSSALYGPFPFANGRPQDLVEDETFPVGPLSVEVKTTFAPPGDGFAMLDLVHGNRNEPVLLIRFMKAVAGQVAQEHRVELG